MYCVVLRSRLLSVAAAARSCLQLLRTPVPNCQWAENVENRDGSGWTTYGGLAGVIVERHRASVHKVTCEPRLHECLAVGGYSARPCLTNMEILICACSRPPQRQYLSISAPCPALPPLIGLPPRFAQPAVFHSALLAMFWASHVSSLA